MPPTLTHAGPDTDSARDAPVAEVHHVEAAVDVHADFPLGRGGTVVGGVCSREACLSRPCLCLQPKNLQPCRLQLRAPQRPQIAQNAIHQKEGERQAHPQTQHRERGTTRRREQGFITGPTKTAELRKTYQRLAGAGDTDRWSSHR